MEFQVSIIISMETIRRFLEKSAQVYLLRDDAGCNTG